MMTMTTTKIILFNGPPRSGKDTAAEIAFEHFQGNLIFQDDINVVKLKFADALKRCTHEAHGLEGYVSDYFEETKEIAASEFFGLTPREAYIKMSEECVKQGFGHRFWGNVLLNKIKMKIKQSFFNIFLISDCGFTQEIVPMTHDYRSEMLIVRLHRPGYTYEGDSRSDIELPGVELIKVGNIETIDKFEIEIIKVVEEWCIPEKSKKAIVS